MLLGLGLRPRPSNYLELGLGVRDRWFPSYDGNNFLIIPIFWIYFQITIHIFNHKLFLVDPDINSLSNYFGKIIKLFKRMGGGGGGLP